MNKLEGYKEQDNPIGCLISTQTFDEATNEIRSSLNGKGYYYEQALGQYKGFIDPSYRRFFYATENVAFFPDNPANQDYFTFENQTYMYWADSKSWIPVKLPFVFPPVDFVLPLTAKHLDVVTIGVQSFVWYDSLTYGGDPSRRSKDSPTTWIAVGLPFSLPTDPYQQSYFNGGTWTRSYNTYYNMSYWSFYGSFYMYGALNLYYSSGNNSFRYDYSANKWKFMGPVSLVNPGLNKFKNTLEGYLVKEYKYREDWPPEWYTYEYNSYYQLPLNVVRGLDSTDPAETIPISQYNQDRLLGTITSSNFGMYGINFPQEIADKLPANCKLMLVPQVVNPVNTLSLPVSVFPTEQIFNPYRPSSGWSDSPQTFKMGSTSAIVSLEKCSELDGKRVGQANWTDKGVTTNYVRRLSASSADVVTYKGIFETGLIRDGSTNYWKYPTMNCKRYLQRSTANEFRISDINYQRQYGFHYPLPWKNPTVPISRYRITDSGANITYNVYFDQEYYLYPDGTEVILAPSQSPFAWSRKNYSIKRPNDANYYNFCFLSDQTCNPQTGTVITQSREFGEIPDGTEIQAYPVPYFLNTAEEQVDFIIDFPLDPSLLKDWSPTLSGDSLASMIGRRLYLMNQTIPSQNGIWIILDPPRGWYRYDSLGGSYYALPPTLTTWDKAIGETAENISRDIYIYGKDLKTGDARMIKISPPWNAQASPVNAGSITIDRWTYPNVEVPLSERQKERILSWVGYREIYTPHSFLPKGLETGRNYYSIKSGSSLQFAATYQDAIEKKAIVFEDAGVGAMAVYTAPANENAQLYQVVNQGTAEEEIKPVDHSKIYYLINKGHGYQIAETKAKALAKDALKLKVYPNTYIQLNLNTGRKRAVDKRNVGHVFPASYCWDPLVTSGSEPLNKAPIIANLKSKLLWSGEAWEALNKYPDFYYGYYYDSPPPKVLKPTVRPNDQDLLVTLPSPLFKAISAEIAVANRSFFYFALSNTTYLGGAGLPNGWTVGAPSPAVTTVLGVTLTQKVQSQAFFTSSEPYARGGYWTPIQYEQKFQNEQDLLDAIAAKINSLLAGKQVLVINQDSNPNISSQTYPSTYFSGLYELQLTVPYTSTADSYYGFTDNSATPPSTPSYALIYYKKQNEYSGYMNLTASISINYDAATQKLTLGGTAYSCNFINTYTTGVSVSVVNTTSALTYLGPSFNLVASSKVNSSLSVPNSLTVGNARPIWPTDKAIRLTFENNKHIWRKLTMQTETTPVDSRYPQPRTAIQDCVEGVDIETTASDFPSQITCVYDQAEGKWRSPAMQSNGFPFKIEVVPLDYFKISTQQSFYTTDRKKILCVKGSPNTGIDLDFKRTVGTKVETSNSGGGTLKTTILQVEYSVSLPAKTEQLAISDPLHTINNNITRGGYWATGPYEFVSIGYSDYRLAYGRITGVNNTPIGRTAWQSPPTATIFAGPRQAGLEAGSGAELKVVTRPTRTSYDGFVYVDEFAAYVEVVKQGSGYINVAPMIDYVVLTGLVNVDGKPAGTKSISLPITVNTPGLVYNGTSGGNLVYRRPTRAEIIDSNESYMATGYYTRPALNRYPAPLYNDQGEELNYVQAPICIAHLKKIELI